ncbi:MAG: lytic transglycosylase domain-containing protein [Erythrobacter sp.]|nr:lytic transglycosylase domain-containing protein [Erythrobacter sp.]
MGGASAQADVLAVGPEGAQWVAGGPPTPAPDMPDVTGTSVAIPAIRAEGTASQNLRSDDRVPAQYAAKIAELSQAYDLSPRLLEAVVWQESRWRADAVSHAGARGLAQLMPGTARDLGVDPDDPLQNLEGGARYLREQLDRFGGDLEKALAAYNAGPGRVIRANGVPNIRETREYVAAIMARLANYSDPGPR